VERSRALGGAEVLVAEADAEWVRRPDPVITTGSGDLQLLPGVLLSSDTIFANPDRTTVSFIRGFPNRLPLSGPVVTRIVEHIVKFKFDRLYGNFDDFLGFRAKRIVRFSANRHIAWIKGDFDDLT